MFIMKDNKIGPAHLKVASSPSYTLAELEAAAKEYCKFRASSLNSVERGLLALELSIFITRLAKREQGKESGR